MSLVMWSPPSGITAVCHTAPSRNNATSVVPPPTSIRRTPSSRSSGVSTDSPEARGCSTTSSTFRPARLTLRTTFWTAVAAPATRWTETPSRLPSIPIGLPDAVLVVDGEALGERVEDLAVGRQAHRPGGVHRARDVDGGDLAGAPLDRHDTLAVDPPDVPAADRHVDGVHLDPGHLLRLGDRALDGLDRRLDVRDHALSEPPRGVLADADHVDAGRRHLADDGTDLGRPHVESRDDALCPAHRQRRSRPAAAGIARVAGVPTARRRLAAADVRAGPAGGAGL